MAQWVERTVRREPVRMIKLLHLDGSVRLMRDDGCNQEGKPNQGRAHLLAMMAKRTTIPDIDPKIVEDVRAGKRPYEDLEVRGPVKNVDGELVMAFVFRLAEAPAKFPFERLPERVRGTIEAVDHMDRLAPFRADESGSWAMPSAQWLSYSAAWQAWRRKNSEATRAMLDEATRANAGEALEKLMKIVSKRGGASSVSP